MSSKSHGVEEEARAEAHAGVPVEVPVSIAIATMATMISRSPARSLAVVVREVVAAEEAAIISWQTTTAVRLVRTQLATHPSLASRY